MSRFMNAVRRLGSLPGVRKVALHPRVRRVGAGILMQRFLIAAWRTTTPWRLVWREISRKGEVHSYRLRSGMLVMLLHGRDMEALYELHHRGEYEPPAPLAGRLDGAGIRILDIGGNIGMFASWALTKWPHASVTSLEPDPHNVDLFRAWIQAAAVSVDLIPAAAATRAGEIPFAIGRGGGSRQVADDTAARVAAVDIFDHLPGVDFVKMDIEGGEWPILLDARMRGLRDIVLVMEYHHNMAPFWPPRDAAVKALEEAGFTTGHGAQNYWGHGTLWAWK